MTVAQQGELVLLNPGSLQSLRGKCNCSHWELSVVQEKSVEEEFAAEMPCYCP